MLFKIGDYPADPCTLAAALPPINRVPFDRMLAADAMAMRLTVVGCDWAIRHYSVETLW